MAGQLADLPGLTRRLTFALAPGASGAGERVSASREAPLPVRLAALTLVAGGSDDARAVFVPKVRSWASVVEVGEMRMEVWQREAVRDQRGQVVMVPVDDQVGVLPVKAWLAKWAVEWRRSFGHATGPASVRRAAVAPAETAPAASGPADLPRALLGLGAAAQPSQRADDPLEAEWTLRYGVADWGPLTARDHRYLTTWLRHACDEYPHIADFAVSLRALVGALHAALGETDDLEYLGRCPEEITDRRTGETSICGATIWHDPYVDKIVCPRCRMETDVRRRIWLARRMLDAWPIDRRRRYPRGLIEILAMPRCVTCGAEVVVEWIDATERSDAERFWRPGRVTCHRNACSEVLA